MNTRERGRGAAALPGLERKLLRRLPEIGLGGTLIAGLFSLSAHWLPVEGSANDVLKHVQLTDAITIGVVIFLWTMVITAALGCKLVMIIKGPVQTADSYPLPDRNRPAPPD